MKKKLALLLATSISLLSACGNTENVSDENNANNQDVEKPQKITMMTNTFLPWEHNEEDIRIFCEEYKRLTGIELENISPDKNEYYEKLNILLATDDSVDVFETGSLFYPNYAAYDLLWDMTDAWENSSIKDITDTKYIDSLKINGRLFGFPLTAGNGTVTYVRQDWLDKLNISQPKTYEEFHDMLKKFKTLGDDIIPITAAGLVNSESPYTLYLREFYQDANPDFYYKDGKCVDGMTEPEMKEALQRMKQAYSEGLIDPDIVKNKTSDCRNKFYSGVVGCFNYWAGTWGVTMDKKTKDKDPNAHVTPLVPLNGIKYLERPPLAMVISKNSKSPAGVFKYLVEFSHDGGDGQMLFTNGVENYHWTKENGNVKLITDHEVPSIYLKAELSINNYKDPIPVDPTIQSYINMFNENSELAPLPITSKDTGNLAADIDIVRREVIESIVTTDMTIDEGYAEYEKRAAKLVKRVLDSVNSNTENTESESKEG